MISSVTFTKKIILRKDYKSVDGMHHVYFQGFINSERVRIPLKIQVKERDWDKRRQRVKTRAEDADRLNLIIEKALSDAHRIELDFRMANEVLTKKKFEAIFQSDAPVMDFVQYMLQKVESRKEWLKPGTYRHHKAIATKLAQFQDRISFFDIDHNFIDEYKTWMKKRGNNPNTINSNLKRIITYLRYARKDGIRFPLNFEDVNLLSWHPDTVFLEQEELMKLVDYFNSRFIPETHWNTLQYFLFSCSTGLRYGDVATITRDNIEGDVLHLVPEKTDQVNKIAKIPLSDNAKRCMNKSGNELFKKVYSNQKTNKYLKEVAKVCGIRKKLTSHVARHTFATAFLDSGNSIEVLNKLLLHASLDTTRRYVHVTDRRSFDQMNRFNDFFRFDIRIEES